MYYNSHCSTRSDGSAPNTERVSSLQLRWRKSLSRFIPLMLSIIGYVLMPVNVWAEEPVTQFEQDVIIDVSPGGCVDRRGVYNSIYVPVRPNYQIDYSRRGYGPGYDIVPINSLGGYYGTASASYSNHKVVDGQGLVSELLVCSNGNMSYPLYRYAYKHILYVKPIVTPTPTYPFVVSKPTNGTVTSAPTGINCGTGGTDCEERYLDGTQVVLTAKPDPGFTFVGWADWGSQKGICSGTETTCELTTYQPITASQIQGVAANFAPITSCSGPTRGLVACYPFDGNANDASGYGNNGTKYGDVVYVPGKIGQAAKFDGLGDYIEVANKVALNPEQLTISAWIKVASLATSSGDHGIVFNKEVQYELAVFNAAYSHDKISANEISFALNPYYPSWNWIPTGNFPELQQFKHVVLTFDQSSVAKLYVNGQKVKENLYPSALKPTSSCLRIGARGCPSTANAFFNGLIDEFRIYNRALSETEVKQLYDEPKAEPVVCAPANYTNGVLQVPSITIDGVTDTYKATMQQYNSGFAFRVTQSSIITGKSSCPATYSPTTGILHIPLVKTKSAIPLNTFQCYDVTMQAFSDRFQLDLDTLKVVKCP